MRFLFFLLAAVCCIGWLGSCSYAVINAVMIAGEPPVGIWVLASLGFLGAAVGCMLMAARVGVRADEKKRERGGVEAKRIIFEQAEPGNDDEEIL